MAKKHTLHRGTLKEDNLIESLVPEPSALSAVRLLSGWLGKSPRNTCWRLYLTPTLDHYLEFDEEQVVHTHRLTAPEIPLGGTMIWLEREARVSETRTTPRETQASFLQGDLIGILNDPQASSALDLTLNPRVLLTTTPCLVGASAKFCIAAGLAVGAVAGVYLSIAVCD